MIHDLTDTKKVHTQLKLINDELSVKNKELDILSTTDRLTGLYNIGYIEMKVGELINRCHCFSENFSLLMMDIDHFKLINDEYGHDEGDDDKKSRQCPLLCKK